MQKNIIIFSLILILMNMVGCDEANVENPDQSDASESEVNSTKLETKWVDDAIISQKKTSSKQGVVYLSTPPMVVDKMLEMAQVKKQDLVYDLGCGDGRIIIAAAKKYGCKAVGFEIEEKVVKQARENVKKNNLEHLIRIEQKDIFKVDLRPADVITLYLTGAMNVQLIPQLQELKDGSRIVSHDFDMKGVIPDKAINFTSKEPDLVNLHMIYLWTTPLKMEKSD